MSDQEHGPFLPHCWTGKADYMAERYGMWSPEHLDAYEGSATCMLMANHDGDHEWVSDSEIGVTFPDAPESP